jgi:hypothetical protein
MVVASPASVPCLVVAVRSEAAAAPHADGGGSIVGVEAAMEATPTTAVTVDAEA